MEFLADWSWVFKLLLVGFLVHELYERISHRRFKERASNENIFREMDMTSRLRNAARDENGELMRRDLEDSIRTSIESSLLSHLAAVRNLSRNVGPSMTVDPSNMNTTYTRDLGFDYMGANEAAMDAAAEMATDTQRVRVFYMDGRSEWIRTGEVENKSKNGEVEKRSKKEKIRVIRLKRSD